MSAPSRKLDLILVGGGLANGLLAFRLRAERPDLDFLVIERDAEIGGIHTWSFHRTDLTAEQNRWMAPFVVHDWPCYQVMFPGLTRRIGIGYRTVTAERFRAVLKASLGDRLRTATEVAEVGPTHVRLADGTLMTAAAVIDGRGFKPSDRMVNRYQTFFGQEVRLREPHGLANPILMDATVAQEGAYRFVYVLPFAPDVLLIEDTYYADTPGIDPVALRARIAAYAAGHGWQIEEVLREESGVLGVTLSGDVNGFWADVPRGQAAIGMRAGLYHPTTGYCLPDAVRLADRIATERQVSSDALHSIIRNYAKAEWRRRTMFRLLNRLLFLAGPAQERYVIMRRFYGMSERLIARFYAGALLPRDKLRLLVGWPPVAVSGALRAIVATGR